MSFGRTVAVAMLLSVPSFGGTNNTIVISAPRLDDLDLMDVTVAADVTVIERDAIERSGSVSVPQILEQQANILVRNPTGGPDSGELSMRGFGENSNLRVLVLVDGHKINRPDMGRIEWGSVPVSNVERIEVIRGGQNVLYGNYALSGVVKITTRRSAGEGVKAGGTFGSHGYLTGRAVYNGTAGDIEYSLGMDSYSYDGFRSNSMSRATTVNGSVGWYPNDTDVVTLRASGGESYTEFPGALLYGDMQDDPTQTYVTGDEFSEDRHVLATLLYETKRAWGAARLNTGFNYRDRSTDSDIFGNYLDLVTYGMSMGPRVRFGSEEQFVMTGFDFNYDRLDADRYLTADRDTELAWGEFERFTVAPYIYAQRTVSEKVIVNGGARFEHARTDNLYQEYVRNQLLPFIETNRGPMPNPFYKNPPDVDAAASYDGVVKKDGWAAELNVSKQLNDQFDVWAGYDRVYRYPVLDEVAVYQGFSLPEPLNKDLDPEEGDNFEAGTRYHNRDWKFSFTGFYLMMDNEIGYDDVNKINTNFGSTRRLGVEVELAWQKTAYGLSTRWTGVDARIHGGANDGNRVPLVPEAHGITSGWIAPTDWLRLTLLYTYVSDQYQGGDEENGVFRKMDAYGLLGFRANIEMSERMQLLVAIDNLTDELYASSAYSGGFYPGAGRSFRVGLDVEL